MKGNNDFAGEEAMYYLLTGEGKTWDVLLKITPDLFSTQVSKHKFRDPNEHCLPDSFLIWELWS